MQVLHGNYDTFYVTVLAVIISLTINSLAGYAFARLKFKGRDLLFLLTRTGGIAVRIVVNERDHCLDVTVHLCCYRS